MELGELVSVLNSIDKKSKDSCPFCQKEPHRFPKQDEEEATRVVSRPDALKAGSAQKTFHHPVHACTTAAHHLIPAIQAYARLRRLVRMGNAVGYDINAPANGIPLPTYKNVEGRKKFGDLPAEDKKQIACEVMDENRAQWHVGSHKHQYGPPETFEWVDESGEKNEISHVVAYDSSVIRLLLSVGAASTEKPLCDEGKNTESDFKAAMDEISADIKDHLDAFGRKKPLESRPFFVSVVAHDYAKERG